MKIFSFSKQQYRYLYFSAPFFGDRGQRKPSIALIVTMACYFHVSTNYLLMGKDHDKVDNRTKLLDVVAQLAEIAKNL